jgi:hypothetical protein
MSPCLLLSHIFKKSTHALYFKITLFKTQSYSIQQDEQQEGTHDSTNRNTSTCPDKVVTKNKADSSIATGTIPPRMVKVNDRNM